MLTISIMRLKHPTVEPKFSNRPKQGGFHDEYTSFREDLTGLLVVDPYNDFISEGGILWPLIKEIAEAVQCVPNMLAVLLAARAAGIRVFFAPHHRDRGPEDEIEGWKYIAPIQKFGHERRIFAAGTWG